MLSCLLLSVLPSITMNNNQRARLTRVVLPVCTALLHFLELSSAFVILDETFDSHDAGVGAVIFALLQMLLQAGDVSRTPERPMSWRTLCFPVQNRTRRRGHEVFENIRQDQHVFWLETGETIDSFNALLHDLGPRLEERRQGGRRVNPLTLSNENALLLCLKWLRTYPRYSSLAGQFNASITVVQRTIYFVTNLLWHYFRGQIRWPGRREWCRILFSKHVIRTFLLYKLIRTLTFTCK